MGMIEGNKTADCIDFLKRKSKTWRASKSLLQGKMRNVKGVVMGSTIALASKEFT